MTHTQDNPPEQGAVNREHSAHPRGFHDNRYVYAVLSRRSGGISVGINLNPDKRCNFDCIYCQVDRHQMPPPEPVDIPRLSDELSTMLEAAADGSLFAEPRFADLPEAQKKVVDVALSGDGEPSQCTLFDAIAEAVITLTGPANIPVVLITNASGLDRETVVAGVDRIMAAGGAIWAKLDAGTAEWYEQVCGDRVPFNRILENLTHTAQRHPITLQTCLFKLTGALPEAAEIDAFADRVNEILDAGGRIAGIQLYTVARPPAEAVVKPIPANTLAEIGGRLGLKIHGVPLRVFA
jgi:wyosine [tRNA(Phe)-imidazoG37] synthetase (radical SAM superfamily)